MFHFVVAALALSHLPARAADEPVRLAPISRWHLEYAEDSCRLARQFGESERPSMVVLERFKPGDYFRLTLTGPAFRRAQSGADATLRFGPAESRQEARFMKAEWSGSPALIFTGSLRIAPYTQQEQDARKELATSNELYLFEPTPIASERELTTTFLSVDAAGAPEVLFDTGSLGEPLAALRKCMDELLTHWGIDVARHKSLSRGVVPIQSPGRWLRSSDYPTSLLTEGAQGVVHFRLSVDKEGNVGECHIQRSTRPQGFDEAVCDALMRRARFEPALDAEGNPIASYYINTVAFTTG